MDLIKTLILTGENNHDWQMSTPFCWLELRKTGRFDLDVTTRPSETLEDADRLKTYDLIFSDYYGSDWSDAAQANFEAAVSGGTGLLVLHAADNAFPGWAAYEKMVGLLWRDGTSHGSFHEFPVTIVDREHPITRGMSDFRTSDELYHNLIHLHDVDYHVLATAFSSKESGGSGQEEPVLVLTQYGEGRVFHLVLGHVWSPGDSMIAFENEGFRQGLVRGAEWAATGKVTLD